jgi:transglutaminase-like putative cysteine protease
MQTTIQPATGEPPTPPGPPPAPERPPIWSLIYTWLVRLTRREEPLFLLRPDDGWLTVGLTALVVFTTIGSIQSVTPPWAPGLQILTLTTGLGLLLGVVAVLQRLLPQAVVHVAAAAIGAWYAFQLTAGAVLNGNTRSLLSHLGIWLHQALANQGSGDNSIFLLFLGVLSFLLAYISVWLVGYAHHPWLAVLANVTVLLINLNWATDDKQVFLVIFLLLALLLLLRFTLAENLRQWKASRLRFSSDLSWDVMQIGAIFVVCVLLLAYILPAGAANPSVTAFWSNPNGAWAQIQQRWGSLFGSLNGPGRGNGIGVFTTNLQLVGDVHLPTTEILRYTSDDPQEYLITQTLDTYDGHGNWTQSLTQAQHFDAGAQLPHSSDAERISKQTVILSAVSPSQRNLFAAGEPASFSLPTDIDLTVPGNVPTSWLAHNPLVAGQQYSAQSYLSTATTDSLRAVPDPAHAAAGDYPKSVVTVDLQSSLNNGAIAPEVQQTAAEWTAGTTNMYDAAQAIESHLRTFEFRYTNGAVPAGQDPVVWFLHVKHGYCTFFASTLALMARALGIPSRIAIGYTNGQLDSAQQNYLVRGTDGHVWTQLYFASYGWINFEPTQGYPLFSRAAASGPTAGLTPTPQGTSGAQATPKGARSPADNLGNGSAPSSPASVAFRDVGLSLAFLLALALLVAGAFMVWWLRLYRGLPPVVSAFARLARLGAWSGAPPRPDQTPYEYADQLGAVVPEERDTLRQLSDLYVGERWGGVPANTEQATTLYDRVRTALTPVIAHRWREVPRWLASRLSRLVGALRRPPRVGALHEDMDASD